MTMHFVSSPARLRIEQAGRDARAADDVPSIPVIVPPAFEADRLTSESEATLEVSSPIIAASYPQRFRIRWRAIIHAVAERTRITVDKIRSRSRNQPVVFARQRAMYSVYAGTKFSTSQIGALLNRDHTTVLHGIKKHARRNGLALPRGLTWGRAR